MSLSDLPPPPQWMWDYALDREIEALFDEEDWKRELGGDT